jgi:hypothetical protein
MSEQHDCACRSRELNKIAFQTNQIWEILSKQPGVKLEAILYAQYLNLIRCSPFTSKKLLDKFMGVTDYIKLKSKEIQSSEELYRSDGTLAIISKINRDNDLEIEFAYREITLLVYDPNEVVKMPIKLLLPLYYKKTSFLKQIEELIKLERKIEKFHLGNIPKDLLFEA